MLTRASKSTTNQRQRTKNPRCCVRVVYIASDTLRHQPMGASHMTMLQLCGPIGSCVLPWWLFIAVDTLCQHPMGTGHMTVLQSCGLMEFCVLQWCHPMLASTRRTSCCTRIITLYGTRKWIQARTPSLCFKVRLQCLFFTLLLLLWLKSFLRHVLLLTRLFSSSSDVGVKNLANSLT